MHNSLSDTNQQQQQFHHLHNHHQHRKHPNKREMMATSKSLLSLHLLLLLIIINLVDLPFPRFVHSSFIRKTEKEYLLPQGSDLELPCQVEIIHPFESVDCTWSANDLIQHPSPGKYDFPKTNSNGDCSLLIRNVSFPEDNGEWQCVIWRSHRLIGPEFCKTNVIVLLKPSAPQIEEFLIVANQTTNITCHIENENPPYPLQWYLNGENISKNASNMASSNLVISTLSYTFEKKHNASMLVCKSSHPMQSQNASRSLNVLYKPIVSVAQKVYPIIEGGNLEIDCAADSNPLAKIYWNQLYIIMGDNFVSSVDGKLRISGISHEMDGAILNCSAKNIVGWSEPKSIELNVLYFPILNEVIGKPHGIVALGGEIRIECKFIGNPKPNVRWAFVDEIRNEEHPLPAGDNSELLAIKNVSYSNEGKYYCEGSNRIHGQDHKVRSSPFPVYVVGKPQFFVPKTSAVGFENENIRIEQKFCSDPAPTKVFWIYDSLAQHYIDPRKYTQEVTDDSSHFDHESGLGSSGGTNGSHIMAGPLVSMHRKRMDWPKCFRAALMLLNCNITDSRDYTLRVYNGGASKAEGVISLQIQSKHSDAI